MKTISEKGLSLIKQFEGFKAKVYFCPAGLPTIGYGTLIDTKEEEWLKTATLNESQATELLKKDCAIFEKTVNLCIKSNITQNQYDSLVVFAYNVGPANFKSSTLLKKINANPNDPDIRTQFMRWNRAGGSILRGLTRRREAEANLYFTK
jgi:lysozyme